MNQHIIPHAHALQHADRVKLHGHRPYLLWFTGLSGSGKSTLANALEQQLYQRQISTYLLDGDNIRSGLNNDLDFSVSSRTENIRRISEVANLFVDAGLTVLTAFISPFTADRQKAREIVGEDRFLEIHVDCPLEVCEARDVKGLYKKARAGEIRDFTGLDSPFEIPEYPDLRVDTANNGLEVSLQEMLNFILPKLKL